ncbi:MAG: sulfatase, partial [Planctomycetales bacterium]|nr:sulfatase [Planctomycetales bacterium]
AATLVGPARAVAEDAAKLPNIVVIFTDDQGYGDLGCFGAKGYKTPNIDRMAAEGTKFTSFYVAQAVCSASRTALLTGCYPNRVGIQGALGPSARHGINDDETLLSEICKQRGYATAAFGKWHLGHHPQFLPPAHGFDEYFGLPYSNDMWPYHPTAKFPPLPMMEGTKVINANVTAADQKQLTTMYTQRAVAFIEKNKSRPFFLYVPHSMPHVPIFCRDENEGRCDQGRYGDVIQEIDWSVGQILAAIKDNGLDDKTLVIFTTDNGPWLSYGNHAGSAGPLREGKGTAWEGGVRVPCVMRWPGKIPAGKVQTEMCATVDILPTVAALIGAKLPEHKIDGLNIWPIIAQTDGAENPRQAYHYYWGNELHAVRSGKWKLHFPHPYRSLTDQPGADGRPGGYSQKKCGLELYDLEADIGESRDMAADHPDVVARLQAIAAEMRSDLGDALQKTPPTNARPAGRLNQ